MVRCVAWFDESEDGMTEIQMEELKATVCMVGIASASNWVFRVLMLVLTLCSFGLVMVLKKKQRLENELEQFKESNKDSDNE